MHVERVEKLKQEYTGQTVMIDSDRPELARWQGIAGQVRTVNFNGRALVEFDGPDRTWYDLEVDYLRVVDTAELNETESDSPDEPSKPPQPEPADEVPSTQKLSRLELARLQRASTEK